MWTFNVHQSPAAIPMSSTATVYPPQPKNNYDYKGREHTHSDLQCMHRKLDKTLTHFGMPSV